MRTRSSVVCAVSLLVGCGSGVGWLDGKVAGNEVSVKEAIFIPLPDGEVYVAAGDQENLCAIMNGQQRPSGSMNALELYLGNWNGSGFQPLVTGHTPCRRPWARRGSMSIRCSGGSGSASPTRPSPRVGGR